MTLENCFWLRKTSALPEVCCTVDVVGQRNAVVLILQKDGKSKPEVDLLWSVAGGKEYFHFIGGVWKGRIFPCLRADIKWFMCLLFRL